jgi:type I restriction enzyme S subunit
MTFAKFSFMEEWKSYKLGDISTIQTGPFGSQLHQSDYVESGVPCIMPTNIGRMLDFQVAGIAHISEGDALKLSRHIVHEGDIVYSRRGDIEKCAYVSQEQDGWFCGTGCLKITINSNLAVPKFVAYYLSTDEIKSWIVGNAVGTTMLNLNTSVLADVPLSLPSIQMQKRCVQILDSIENKIALNNRINHNLEVQAKNHFEEWCRQCNEEKTIAELSFNILDYSQNQRDKVVLLNSSDVTEGVFETLPYVDNKNLKGQFKKRFKKGDILYSEIRPRNHHYAICYFDAEDYIASTRLMIIRRNPELVSSDALLYQYLLMRRVEEEFTSKTESRSGTFPQGNYEDLSSSMVPYSRENQIISKTLDAFYSIIWLNMEENKRLASFRDALLPQLMLGDLTC